MHLHLRGIFDLQVLLYSNKKAADLYLSWHKEQNSKILPLHFLNNCDFFLVLVAFCFLFKSKPLQVISSYNQRERIRDVNFWHLFLKSLPSLSNLEEVPSRKRQKIKKSLFFLTFIPRYSNSEVNNSRTLIKRYAKISRFIFYVEAIISL